MDCRLDPVGDRPITVDPRSRIGGIETQAMAARQDAGDRRLADSWWSTDKQDVVKARGGGEIGHLRVTLASP